MIAVTAFYVFAAILIGSAVMVVTSRNPVHSVLFLILGFFNAAGLFLLTGAEFLALILVIVYVGAVAVLFLFVVMMLDIDFTQLREGYQKYAPVGLAVGALLFGELLFALGAWDFAPKAGAMRQTPFADHGTNTTMLGHVIYTDYVLLFQASGLVLLVAMIGAIVLTLRPRQDSRRQSIEAQISRTPEQTLSLVRPQIGEGVRPADYHRRTPIRPAAHAGDMEN